MKSIIESKEMLDMMMVAIEWGYNERRRGNTIENAKYDFEHKIWKK